MGETVSEIFEDIKKNMCDHYCKYPQTYVRESEDWDAGYGEMVDEVCVDCPLNRL